MSDPVKILEKLMASKEDEHLEFKEAKQNYHFEKLVKYCVALSNERGGKFILGVSDKRPRKVVGSQAFKNLERTKSGLNERLRSRIDAEEITHPDGRVIIFHVPSRPVGMPVQYEGSYWMRSGEDLVPMTPDQLKKIFDEAGPDFSAETCPGASMNDLLPEAVDDFRRRWIKKSGNENLSTLSQYDLLVDAELIMDSELTYAALMLFGKEKSLGKYLANAEIIFEYRYSEAAGPAQQRVEYRQGFFSFYEALWKMINQRNDIQHYQDGLFMVDVPTFNEGAIREALLNAVSHRDYHDAGSIFIRQYQRRIEIISPGGFPPGINVDNILDRQFPRNRRLAETFGKCGLVERAGQGANRIFESCLMEGKPLPDFHGTDDHQVSIILHGQIQDPRFIQFMEEVGKRKLASFSTHDLLVLNLVFRGISVPDYLAQKVPFLIDQGLLERPARKKLILSKEFHEFLGEKGTYTRKKGLDKETKKALLLMHIKNNEREGSRFAEFYQVLTGHSRDQIRYLIRELVLEGKIYKDGNTRAAKWFPERDD